MRDSILQAAVIGCGAIARKKHIPVLLEHPAIHLRTLCSRSLQSALACREAFGCRHTAVTADPEAVFSDPDTDLVVIAAPNGVHEGYALRALAGGKHVICEKPMACAAAGAEQMLEESLRRGRMLHISYQNRYTDQALHARRLVDEGVVSGVYYAKAYALRRRAVPTWGPWTEQSQGGGPLLDIGGHAIDLALWLSGCFEPDILLGAAYNRLGRKGSEANRWGPWDPGRYETEDLAVGLVRMKNGLTLSVEASYALNIAEEKEAAVDLFGVTGGLELRQEGLTLIQELGGRMFVAGDRTQAVRRDLTPQTQAASPARRELDAVAEMLLAGKTADPAAPQALAVARIIDGLYRSARTGEAVRFPESAGTNQSK